MNKIIIVAVCSLLLASCGNQPKSAKTGKEAPVAAATAPAEQNIGKEIYLKNCTTCHALNKDMAAPALAGVVGRWKNDTTRLVSFIKNATQYIKAEGEQSYIGQLNARWYHLVMPPYAAYTDNELRSVIRYIDQGIE